MSETPDRPFDPIGFSEAWWTFNRLLGTFEDHLLCLGDEGFDFDQTWTDSYDSSLEIRDASPGSSLNEAQLKLLADCGFQRVWLHPEGGAQIYYVITPDA